MATQSGRASGDDAGFTLMEVVIAIAISAFIFSALASLLGASLKTLGVQKARTQGNEVATQGMEDLQRLDFDALALCDTASPTPDGFETYVSQPACDGSETYYDPCHPDAPGTVPAAEYDCSRGSITYNVKRYIAWGDPARTEKMLAVHVTWTDASGPHEVAQQSSLRIPGQGALIGVPPPTVDGISVPATVLVDAAGLNTAPITVTANSTGLEPSDRMQVVFTALEGGASVGKHVTLTSADGLQWTGTIPAGTHTFGQGTQFFVATAIRVADGRANSRVSQVVAFCQNAGVCPPPGAPTVSPSPLVGPIDIEASGALASDLQVSATTTNVSPADSVVVVFQTLSGAESLVLQPTTPGFVCEPAPGTCTATWSATISKTVGYRFSPGYQALYFTAYQGTATGYLVDNGSTGAQESNQVNFE